MLEEWKLPCVQETFSCKTSYFKMDTSARTLQKPGMKQNKTEKETEKINRTVKLCTPSDQ